MAQACDNLNKFTSNCKIKGQKSKSLRIRPNRFKETIRPNLKVGQSPPDPLFGSAIYVLLTRCMCFCIVALFIYLWTHSRIIVGFFLIIHELATSSDDELIHLLHIRLWFTLDGPIEKPPFGLLSILWDKFNTFKVYVLNFNTFKLIWSITIVYLDKLGNSNFTLSLSFLS